MILDRGLVAAGDEQDLLDAVAKPVPPPRTARSACARPAAFPWAATWWPAAGGSPDPRRERLRFESPSEYSNGRYSKRRTKNTRREFIADLVVPGECYSGQRKSEWRISRNNSRRCAGASRGSTANTRAPRPRRRVPPLRPAGALHRGPAVRRSGHHAAWASTSKPRSSGSATAATAASDISDLADLPDDLLDPLSAGAIPSAHPTRWAFLDTETTGLAGGTGTYAFLIGVGSIDSSRLPPAPVLHARLRRRSVAALPPRGVPGAVRRAHHLQRQVLRPAAAGDPLPHGRARAIRSTAWSTWTCSSARAACGNCASKAAAWWTWKIAFWAWSARAICPAR